MILKVGLNRVKSEGKNERSFSYRDIKYDDNGWADRCKYLPIDYDLLILKRYGKKDTPGWYTGSKWEGLRLDEEDKVIAWKLMPEETM